MIVQDVNWIAPGPITVIVGVPDITTPRPMIRFVPLSTVMVEPVVTTVSV